MKGCPLTMYYHVVVKRFLFLLMILQAVACSNIMLSVVPTRYVTYCTKTKTKPEFRKLFLVFRKFTTNRIDGKTILVICFINIDTVSCENVTGNISHGTVQLYNITVSSVQTSITLYFFWYKEQRRRHVTIAAF